MKLFHAAGSPYARIIRVVLRETGLDRRVPEEEVTLRDPNSALLPPKLLMVFGSVSPIPQAQPVVEPLGTMVEKYG